MHRSIPIDHHVPGQVRAWAVAVAMLLLILPGCDWPNDNSDSGPDYRDRLASVGGYRRRTARPWAPFST